MKKKVLIRIVTNGESETGGKSKLIHDKTKVYFHSQIKIQKKEKKNAKFSEREEDLTKTKKCRSMGNIASSEHTLDILANGTKQKTDRG